MSIRLKHLLKTSPQFPCNLASYPKNAENYFLRTTTRMLTGVLPELHHHAYPMHNTGQQHPSTSI